MTQPAHRPPADGAYDAVPDLGALYDAVPAYAARRDVAFYVDEARRTGGRVLELGCGTGRILIPTARAGHLVAGLDGSAEMLSRLAAKLAAEPEDVRARVAVQQGDVRDFDLGAGAPGATFDLVTAPFRVLQHVTTVDDQLRCLRSVARHLAPGGRFVFDVFNPLFTLLVRDRSAETEDTPPVVLPDGRTMRRTFRVPRVRWTEQTSEIELIFYVQPPDGPEERHVQAFDMRWYVPAELVHLLARTGFRVQTIHGNFDRSPLTDDAPEMVVCAERLTD